MTADTFPVHRCDYCCQPAEYGAADAMPTSSPWTEEPAPARSQYLVRWEVDIFDAADPQDAAARALAMQRNPDSIATVFRVIVPDGRSCEVDLSEPEDADDLADRDDRREEIDLSGSRPSTVR